MEMLLYWGLSGAAVEACQISQCAFLGSPLHGRVCGSILSELAVI